jgi:predicted O-methyltransferase YrrM
MPSLNRLFLLLLRDDYRNYKNFIESGTYLGHTTFRLAPYFKTVHTIEIKKELYESVKARYKGDKVNFHLGDSSHVLKKILPTITGHSIIFLDGHWSAGNTGRGKKDCPLLEEIIIINNLHKGRAIIIIDDYRMFGKGPSTETDKVNWEDISKDELLNILKKRITKTYHLPSQLHRDDRLIIHIRNI